MLKSEALKSSKGKFEALVSINNECVEDLHWWVDNIENAFKPVERPKADITIHTDASKMGWGAVVNKTAIGGRWTSLESQEHINSLELKALFMGLKSFYRNLQHKQDVQDVLHHSKTLVPPITDITLKDLTLKLTMLIALVSAQRRQSIQLLNIDYMVKDDTFLRASLEIIFEDLPVKMTSTNEFVPVMKQNVLVIVPVCQKHRIQNMQLLKSFYTCICTQNNVNYVYNE
ncbi:Transposon Tf2-6 poly [Paramuricea clavata]|uniref:Transposon Tf2-6 poly n=1 Tax=Paramuricea clavata TaxID=317549 RepID=A0A6S7JCL5_PARCT|nr:Transposon Tf2-6 poly [Paramuricea clavata]